MLNLIVEVITSLKNFVVAPSSADSANSHHGCFSRVQNANGIAEIVLFKICITCLFSNLYDFN